jgi:hypothetical protein
MTMCSRFCLLAVCLLPCLAHARLGDTERQCVERYGSAIPPKKYAAVQRELISGLPHATYHYQGWNIRVVFAGGRVVAQEYQKKPPHPSGKDIKADEHAAILEGETAGLQWTKSLTHPLQASSLSFIIANAVMGGQHWTRSDGAYATLTPMAYSMVFYSKEGLEVVQQAAAAKEQRRKEAVPKF